MLSQLRLPDLASVLLIFHFLQVGSGCTCTPTPCAFVSLNQVTGSDQYLSIICTGANFVGTIPTNVGLVTSLEVLDLSHNLLTGSLPVELSALEKLHTLNVESNFLTGMLPEALQLLSRMTVLRIGNNRMTGQISQNITSLPRLAEFDALPNLFEGEVPSFLACSEYESVCGVEVAALQTFAPVGPGLLASALLLLCLLLCFAQCVGECESDDGTGDVCGQFLAFIMMGAGMTGVYMSIGSLVSLVNWIQCDERYQALSFRCLATDLPAPGTVLSGLTLAPTTAPTGSMAPSSFPTRAPTPTTVSPTKTPTLTFESANPELFAALTTGLPLLCIVVLALLVPKRYRDLTVYVGFALFDFAGDLAYISTQSFTSPALFGAAVTILVLPAFAFSIAIGRVVIWTLVKDCWVAIGSLYKAVYDAKGGADYEEYDKLYKVIHVLLLYVLKVLFFVVATVIGIPVVFLLGFIGVVVGIALIVNLKLLAIPTLANWLDELRGRKEASSLWFNGSIVVEIAFESIPELIIVLVNTFSFNGETDAIFIATVVGSVIDIVNAGFPYVYYTIKFGSLTQALHKGDLYGYEASRDKRDGFAPSVSVELEVDLYA